MQSFNKFISMKTTLLQMNPSAYFNMIVMSSLVMLAVYGERCLCAGDKRGFVRIGKPSGSTSASLSDVAADGQDVADYAIVEPKHSHTISLDEFSRIARRMGSRKRQSSFVRIGELLQYDLFTN